MKHDGMSRSVGTRFASWAFLITLACLSCPAGYAETPAQPANLAFPIAELEKRLAAAPFAILTAAPSRGLSNEIGLRATVRFEDGTEMELKIRPAAHGASEFNNEPRYELAAYRLQSLFLDAPDYVVPPTALRMLPREALTAYAPKVERTFRASDDVLVVVQYWMQNVAAKSDILDQARFAVDAAYARRLGNLNLLTYAIRHGDSNYGNVLVSNLPEAPHAWAVDNGVAFDAPESDRGDVWAEIRVAWLPAAAVERLRRVDLDALEQALAVLAEWQLVSGRFEPVAPGKNLSPYRGVRIRDDRVQLGMTTSELKQVARRIVNLGRKVDKGRIETR